MRLLYLTQREQGREQDPPDGPRRITEGEDGWSGYGTPPPKDVLAQIPFAEGTDPNLN